MVDYSFKSRLQIQTTTRAGHRAETTRQQERPNTHKSGSLPAVPWLNIQRHFEQVVSKLLLAPVAHRVQVLEEPLRKETTRFEFRLKKDDEEQKLRRRRRKSAHPDVVFHLQTVGLVLVLLDLSCDFCHFPPFAEVDQLLAVAYD